jgi:hypothetical protein
MVRSPVVLAMLLTIVGCGGGGGFIDAGPTGGTMTFSWKLVDANQQLLTCTQVGAENVNVTINDLSNGGSMIETFTCDSTVSTSLMMLDGTYSVDFALVTNGTTLATGPSTSGIILANGINVPVSSSFPVDATGGLNLLLATGAGGNCAAAPGGAGITGIAIALEHNDTGPCDTATFAIGAGATQPAGSYTVNCGAPTLGACIENDQPLTVSGLTSGRYTIQVTGDIGATACWSIHTSLQVPAAGGTLMQTLPLVDAIGTPGC